MSRGDANRQIAQRLLDEVFERGDFGAIDELIHPEFINHEAPEDNPQAGRHVGEFLGREPTGRDFATKQIHIWRIEDGKVREHWSVRDDLGQAFQLGFVGA